MSDGNGSQNGVTISRAWLTTFGLILAAGATLVAASNALSGRDADQDRQISVLTERLEGARSDNKRILDALDALKGEIQGLRESVIRLQKNGSPNQGG